MTHAENWKLGLSSCCMSDKSIEETLSAYDENGIEYIELSYGYIDEYSSIDWNASKHSLAQHRSVKPWSFHLPFGPFSKLNLATFDKALLNSTLELYKSAIDHISELGIKLAVVHPSGEPNSDGDRAALLDISAESLAVLAEYAEPRGVTVAVENIPRTCLGNKSAEIKSLISRHRSLKVCFDTNHLLDQRNADFVRDIGEKIITLHVSDYDFLNERHWLPYEGKQNWVELVTALEEANYNGVWMYEIGFHTPKTIDRGRDLTFDDFRQNRNACVKKAPFRAFGTPNYDGCMSWTFYTEPHID